MSQMKPTNLLIILLTLSFFVCGISVSWSGSGERIANYAIDQAAEAANQPRSVTDILAQNRESVYSTQRSNGAFFVIVVVLLAVGALAFLFLGRPFLKEARLGFKAITKGIGNGRRPAPALMPPPVYQIEAVPALTSGEEVTQIETVGQITGGAQWLE